MSAEDIYIGLFKGQAVVEALESKATLDDYLAKCKVGLLQGRKVTSISAEDAISVSGTGISTLRSTVNAVNEVYHNVSPGVELACEGTKLIGAASIFFAAKHILLDDFVTLFNSDKTGPKRAEEILDTTLNITSNISSIADGGNMVGEAATALFGLSGRIVKFIATLGIISGFLGLVALIIDIKAWVQAHLGKERLKQDEFNEIKAGYKEALINRLHKIEVTRALNVLVTVISFIAFSIFTFAAAPLAVIAWSLMAVSMAIALASKGVEWYSDARLRDDLSAAAKAA